MWYLDGDGHPVRIRAAYRELRGISMEPNEPFAQTCEPGAFR